MKIHGLTFGKKNNKNGERNSDWSSQSYRETAHGMTTLFQHFYHVRSVGGLKRAVTDDIVAMLLMGSGSGLLMSIIRGLYYRIFMRWSLPAVVGKCFKVVNKSNIKIGKVFWAKDYVTLFAGGELSMGNGVVMAERSTIWSGEGGVKIGNNFFLGMNSYISAIGGSVIIGNNVMVADNVSMYTWNHRFKKGKKPFTEMGGITKGIKIGNNCWLATGVKVLAGTDIGNNCVVAAGTVLTGKKYPANSVIAGVPGKVVRKIK